MLLVEKIKQLALHESYLDLSSCLDQRAGSDIIQDFKAIPDSVMSLGLHKNGLGNRTDPDLIQILQAIPASVTSLDLSGNNLCYRSDAELARVLQVIPNTVTSLNLSGNGLSYRADYQSALAFQAIPASVISLHLGANRFDLIAANELFRVLQTIPKTITSLDLSGNYLGQKTVAELAPALAAIPTSVTSLNMSGNCFCYETGAEWLRLFQSIPDSVTSVDFSGNNLAALSHISFSEFLSAIPEHITCINLSYNKLFLKKTYKEIDKTLQALGTNRERFILTGNGESDITRLLTALTRKPNTKTSSENRGSSHLENIPVEMLATIMSFLHDSKGNRSSPITCMNQLTGNPLPKILELIEKTETAVNKYLEYSKNKTLTESNANGFFTHQIPGETERKHAKELLNKIKETPSWDAKVAIIDILLKDNNSRIHQHSFASFLLNELKEFKEFNTASSTRLLAGI